MASDLLRMLEQKMERFFTHTLRINIVDKAGWFIPITCFAPNGDTGLFVC